MTGSRTNLILSARSAFAGWVTLLVVLAAFVFSFPQEPPTVGYAGAFVVWGIILSLFYAIDFLLVAALYHLVLRPWMQPLPRWLQSLIGAGLFSLVALFFVVVYGHFHDGLGFSCGTAALCGFVCFLCRAHPET